MIKRQELERIRKEFENNPSLLSSDDKFAVKYIFARMLEETDISIKALDSIVKNRNNDYLQRLRNAWDDFLNNENLP